MVIWHVRIKHPPFRFQRDSLNTLYLNLIFRSFSDFPATPIKPPPSLCQLERIHPNERLVEPIQGILAIFKLRFVGGFRLHDFERG